MTQGHCPSEHRKFRTMADCILLITYQNVKHITLEY